MSGKSYKRQYFKETVADEDRHAVPSRGWKTCCVDNRDRTWGNLAVALETGSPLGSIVDDLIPPISEG